MSTEYFVAREDIQKMAWELIRKQHPDLAGSLNAGDLIVVFRDKAAKSGGKAILGAARKAAPLANALAGEHYVFILELPQDEWENLLDSKQKEAALDQLLCSCRATTNKKTADVKFSVVRADYQVFRENVERYGMWFPKGEDGSSEEDKDVVGEMFTSSED